MKTHYTEAEVSAKSNVSLEKVRRDYKRGRILADKKWGKKFSEEAVEEYNKYLKIFKGDYAELNINYNESFKFLPTLPRTHKMINPMRFRGKSIFLIGEWGTIMNAKTMVVRKLQKTGNGHLQVDLHKGCYVEVHILVALMWCPNAKFKKYVHHINGIKTDNRALNLIYMTYEEHRLAHKLFDAIEAAETESEKEMANQRYSDYIEKVREDNREEKEDLMAIPDAEDPQRSILFVTYASFLQYQATKNERDLVIRGQWCW